MDSNFWRGFEKRAAINPIKPMRSAASRVLAKRQPWQRNWTGFESDTMAGVKGHNKYLKELSAPKAPTATTPAATTPAADLQAKSVTSFPKAEQMSLTKRELLKGIK